MSKLILLIVVFLIIRRIIKLKGKESFFRESEWLKKLKDGFAQVAKEIERQKQASMKIAIQPDSEDDGVYDDLTNDEKKEPVTSVISPPPLKTAHIHDQGILPSDVSGFSLQKAVIWSEILAPPVSLRND